MNDDLLRGLIRFGLFALLGFLISLMFFVFVIPSFIILKTRFKKRPNIKRNGKILSLILGCFSSFLWYSLISIPENPKSFHLLTFNDLVLTIPFVGFYVFIAGVIIFSI